MLSAFRGKYRQNKLAPGRMQTPLRLEWLEDRLAPARLTVSNVLDAGSGSLRQAILDANQHPGNDTIEFAGPARGIIHLAAPLPDLTDDLTILGPGTDSLIVAGGGPGSQHEFGLLWVNSGVAATISDLTLSNAWSRTVAAINNFGNLTLRHVSLNGNDASGGALHNMGQAALSDSMISGNVGYPQAGIWNDGGSISLVNSTVLFNLFGAGILSTGGNVSVRNSTIANNEGGGIRCLAGTVEVDNSTIVGNRSQAQGAGIFAGGTLRLINSIVAQNIIDPGVSVDQYRDVQGNVVSLGHNLIGDYDGVSGFTASDLVGTIDHPFDPQLGFLQDNGGPGLSLAPLLGSPALDAGDNATAPDTDQRGLSRIANGTIDIGAVEGIAQPFFQLDQDSALVDESAGSVSIVVRRGGDLTQPATIEIITQSGSAVGDQDYQALHATVDFQGGEDSKTVSIPIVDDDLTEGRETFRVLLSKPPDGFALTSPSAATVTINDNDGGFFQINPTQDAVREGDIATLIVSRTDGVAPVSIHYSTGDDTAVAGRDYISASGDLVFGTGEIAKEIRVPILAPAALGEDPTSFIVTIANPSSGAVISQGTATILVVHDHLLVTNTNDSGPGSLRQAILDANKLTGPDTIQFAPAAVGIIDLDTALPDVSSDMDIEGPGPGQLTVRRSLADRTPDFRIFQILPNVQATIAGLTLENGVGHDRNLFTTGFIAPSSSINIIDFPSPPQGGGAIDNRGGRLTVRDAVLTGNHGIGEGGAIYSDSGAILTLENTIIRRNRADTGGGGVSNHATLSVFNSVIEENTTDETSGFGGALNSDGSLTITGSTIRNNSAYSGGGIRFGGSNQVTIVDSTISGNQAKIAGGGIDVQILPTFLGPQVTIEDSTISGNSAGESGGGVVVYGNVGLTILRSTISDNRVTGDPVTMGTGGGVVTTNPLVLENSIVARNHASSGPDLFRAFSQTQIVSSLGHNLIGDGRGITGFLATDLVGTGASPLDPLLGALQDIGGQTQTQPLLPGSPAIDAGDNTAAPQTDQRGLPRILNGTIDMGAVEGPAMQFFQFASASASIVEDGGMVTLMVQRGGDLSASATVAYHTESGSATMDQDFASTSGIVTFRANEASRPIEISVMDDLLIEGPETFSVSLENPSPGAVLADTDACMITIIDNDGGGAFRFDNTDIRVREGSIAHFVVSRSDGYAPVTVHLATADQTAQARRDYIPVSTDLTFAAGELTKTVAVEAPFNQQLNEVTRSFLVTLAGPTGGAILVNDLARGTIVDNPIPVANLDDSGPGSLRQAILDANAFPGDDTITFVTGLSGTIDLLTALPDLESNIVLEGPRADFMTIQRSHAAGTPDFRIFRTSAQANVILAGITITNGQITDSGAGIFNYGTLTLRSVIVRDNISDRTSNNIQSEGGGGIDNWGSLTLVDSMVSHNRTFGPYGAGGGIANSIPASTLALMNSTVNDNQATASGGIFNDGTLTIVNSTISGNHADRFAGGIGTEQTLVIQASTISDNSSGEGGGGIQFYGVVTIANSIIAGNTGPLADLGGSPATTPAINSLGHNLIGVADQVRGFLASDLVGTPEDPLDPRLSPLLDNGGPTLTQALLPNSPAIDAGGDGGTSLTFDQRGSPFPRQSGLATDIGAFESPSSSDTRFVISLYRDILGRIPDLTGGRAWVQFLGQGAARPEAVQGFWSSSEHRSLQVDRLFVNYLHRDANTTERIAWMEVLQQGLTETDAARAILVSDEYTTTHRSISVFIAGLYTDVLGRAPEALAIPFWNSLLSVGVGRDQVAQAFLTSTEAATHLVDDYFQSFLHRQPDVSSEQAWISVLTSHQQTADQVEEAFLTSLEYAQQDL